MQVLVTHLKDKSLLLEKHVNFLQILFSLSLKRDDYLIVQAYKLKEVCLCFTRNRIKDLGIFLFGRIN